MRNDEHIKFVDELMALPEPSSDVLSTYEKLVAPLVTLVRTELVAKYRQLYVPLACKATVSSEEVQSAVIQHFQPCQAFVTLCESDIEQASTLYEQGLRILPTFTTPSEMLPWKHANILASLSFLSSPRIPCVPILLCGSEELATLLSSHCDPQFNEDMITNDASCPHGTSQAPLTHDSIGSNVNDPTRDIHNNSSVGMLLCICP